MNWLYEGVIKSKLHFSQTDRFVVQSFFLEGNGQRSITVKVDFTILIFQYSGKFLWMVSYLTDCGILSLWSKDWLTRSQYLRGASAKFEYKVEEKNQNQKFLNPFCPEYFHEGCLNMPTAPFSTRIIKIYLNMIIKWMNFVLRSFRFWLFLQLLFQNFFWFNVFHRF